MSKLRVLDLVLLRRRGRIPKRCSLASVCLLLAGIAATSTPAKAQCPYPCWTEVETSAFSADQYAYAMAQTVGNTPFKTTMPAPPNPVSPYNWQQPYPYVSTFSGAGSFSELDDTGCTVGDAYESGIPGASLPMRIYSGGSPVSPSTTLISRSNPTYIERTSLLSNVRGLGIQARFAGGATTGGASASGHVLTQAIFYHSQRCYTADTEFGFARTVNGNEDGNNDGAVIFYYSIYTNCGADTCSIGGTNGTTQDGAMFQPQVGGYNAAGSPLPTQVSLPIPTGTNSQGGLDWLYEAWLTSSGSPATYTWHIQVIDPYDFGPPPSESSNTTTLSVQSWFNTYAAQMLTTAGLNGYMTITTNLNTQWQTPPSPTTDVELDTVKLFAP